MKNFLGIIDRGVGGLGFYKKLRETSNRPVLYFADSGYLPYGEVPKKALRQRLQTNINFLHAKGAKQIIIACNSASAAYADTKLVKGIIPFGVSSVLQQLSLNSSIKKLALIAGKSTVISGVYSHLFSQQGLRVKQRIAQPLSIHIENGVLQGEQFDKDLKQILRPIKNYDLLLHACTRYPAANAAIGQIMKPGCLLVDPVDLFVAWVNKNWPSDESEAETRFYCSGDLAQFRRSAEKAFQLQIENLLPAPNDAL